VIVLLRFNPSNGYRAEYRITDGVLPGWLPNQNDAIAALRAQGWYDCAGHGELSAARSRQIESGQPMTMEFPSPAAYRSIGGGPRTKRDGGDDRSIQRET
jgi:hypothetical protein